tara:strand:- start:1020 stop:1907 length:888 start_codon:yes stop_codon:yes gene_type:complete
MINFNNRINTKVITMTFNNILSYGTLNPDFIYFVDSLPKVGGDIRSSEYKIRPGGTAINSAENISNWNINVSVAGNSIGNDEFGKYLSNYLDSLEIDHKKVLKKDHHTPSCSIYVDKNGERTIISSGYDFCTWSNIEDLNKYDSLMVDRYSIPFIKKNLENINDEIFITQAGYQEEITYKINFLVVSKDEIDVIEANNLLNNNLVDWILLTSSNLPARLINKDGVLEITPPEFKTKNSTGAGDATAAYIAAFGIENIVESVKGACASGAIVAGTNQIPSLEKIREVAELVEIKPR